MSSCCSPESLTLLESVVRILVSEPEQVAATCNGSGMTLSVSERDAHLFQGPNLKTLSSLNIVRAAMHRSFDSGSIHLTVKAD